MKQFIRNRGYLLFVVNLMLWSLIVMTWPTKQNIEAENQCVEQMVGMSDDTVGFPSVTEEIEEVPTEAMDVEPLGDDDRKPDILG